MSNQKDHGCNQRGRKNRQDLILDTATRLFSEQSYQTVTVEEIGAAVGMSGSGIYHYFPNKESLLFAVIDRWMQQYDEICSETDWPGRAPTDRLIAMIDQVIDLHLQHQQSFVSMLAEARHLSDDIIRKANKRRETVSQWWIKPLLQLHPDLSPAEARFMFDTILSMCHFIVDYQPRISRARLVELLSQMGQSALLTSPSLAPRKGLSTTLHGTNFKPAVGGWRISSRRAPRERIVEAATQLFRLHGFNGVGIDEIGIAAGVVGPNVYRYFQNKEDILYTISIRVSEKLASSVTHSLIGVKTEQGALERLIESYLEMVIEERDLMAVYWAENYALSPQLRKAIARGERSYIDDWAKVLRGVRPKLTEVEARTIAYGVLSLINCNLQPLLPLPPDQVRPLLRSMAFHAALSRQPVGVTESRASTMPAT